MIKVIGKCFLTYIPVQDSDFQCKTPMRDFSILHCYDWLIDYLRFYVPLKNISLIAGEGLQNLGLCLAIRAFGQGGIFIMPLLLWHGTSVYPVSSERPPHLVAFYDTRGDVEDLF
jgi:hypothetical protein